MFVEEYKKNYDQITWKAKIYRAKQRIVHRRYGETGYYNRKIIHGNKIDSLKDIQITWEELLLDQALCPSIDNQMIKKAKEGKWTM